MLKKMSISIFAMALKHLEYEIKPVIDLIHSVIYGCETVNEVQWSTVNIPLSYIILAMAFLISKFHLLENFCCVSNSYVFNLGFTCSI